MDFIERGNILCVKQYGFRKKHSTKMAIIELEQLNQPMQ